MLAHMAPFHLNPLSPKLPQSPNLPKPTIGDIKQQPIRSWGLFTRILQYNGPQNRILSLSEVCTRPLSEDDQRAKRATAALA